MRRQATEREEGKAAAAWGRGLALGAAVSTRAAARCRHAAQFERVAAQWLRVLANHPAEGADIAGGVDLTAWAGSPAWAAVEAGFHLGVLLGAVAALGRRMTWDASAAGRVGAAAGLAAALSAPWPEGERPGAIASAALPAALTGPLAATVAAAGLYAEFARATAQGVTLGCTLRAPERRAHLKVVRRSGAPVTRRSRRASPAGPTR
jgi:hypothetical protein